MTSEKEETILKEIKELLESIISDGKLVVELG